MAEAAVTTRDTRYAICGGAQCPFAVFSDVTEAVMEARCRDHTATTGHVVHQVSEHRTLYAAPVHLITGDLSLACGHDGTDLASAVPGEVTCPGCQTAPTAVNHA